MSRPTILSGIGMAFGLGIILLPLATMLDTVLGPPTAVRAALVISQAAYLCYLIRVTRPRLGLISLIIVNLALGLALLGLPLADRSLFLCWAVWLSLNRILLFHRSILAAVLDLLTAGLGVLFLMYLLRDSGVLPIAVLGFYLVQSWAGSIPWAVGISTAKGASPEGDSFQAPFRQAQSAISQMLKTHGPSP